MGMLFPTQTGVIPRDEKFRGPAGSIPRAGGGDPSHSIGIHMINKNKSQLPGWLFLLCSVKLNGLGIFDKIYIGVLFSGYIALQKGGRCL